MYTVRTTGHLHKSKLFNFKLRSVRDTAHKNSTPSKARRPRLVTGTKICFFFPSRLKYINSSRVPTSLFEEKTEIGEKAITGKTYILGILYPFGTPRS